MRLLNKVKVDCGLFGHLTVHNGPKLWGSLGRHGHKMVLGIPPTEVNSSRLLPRLASVS